MYYNGTSFFILQKGLGKLLQSERLAQRDVVRGIAYKGFK